MTNLLIIADVPDDIDPNDIMMAMRYGISQALKSSIDIEVIDPLEIIHAFEQRFDQYVAQ
jgi:hypothetical protein